MSGSVWYDWRINQPKGRCSIPRTCTVCQHSDRAIIEKQLVSGTSYRVIARQYAIGHDSLKRHVDGHHIDTAIKQAQAEKDEARALDVARQLNNINQVVNTIMYNALRDKKGHGLALAASDRILKQLDFQHRVNQLDELEREVEELKALLRANGDDRWQR